jgi:hypothetical protein
MSDSQEDIKTAKIPKIDRIRLVSREIVLQITIGNKHQVPVSQIEDDTDARIRGIVEDLAQLMARESAIRWEQRAEQTNIDILSLQSQLLEARSKIIQLLTKDEEDLSEHPLKGWQPVPVTEPKLTPMEGRDESLPWCPDCKSYHDHHADCHKT